MMDIVNDSLRYWDFELKRILVNSILNYVYTMMDIVKDSQTYYIIFSNTSSYIHLTL